jgi:hypothetical protein
MREIFNMQPATRHLLQQYAADCFVLDTYFATEQNLTPLSHDLLY